MSVLPKYECNDCGQYLEEGEFMAVVGNAPPTGPSAPIGRSDAVLAKVGKIYCEKCFAKRYKEKNVD